MKLIGLTGSIACGKSTVAGLLSGYQNITVILADDISKAILAEPKHRPFLQTLFGDVVPASGKLDHKEMARVFFSNKSVKTKLEAYLHPLVWEYIQLIIERAPPHQIIIVESAILYEIGWQDRFDCMVVAGCRTAEQQRRLYDERGLTEQQVINRMNNQMSAQAKAERADMYISTDGSIEKLPTRVAQLRRQLMKLPERNVL